MRMSDLQPTLWLSRDEVIFDRMVRFHRERVEALIAGFAPLLSREGGLLVAHLIPQACIEGRHRFDVSQLQAHGTSIGCLNGNVGHPRFNIDGLSMADGDKRIRAYSQFYRDGRLEAVASDIFYKQNDCSIFRDTTSERSLFSVVSNYLKFCKEVGLIAPVWLFAALVGCEGMRMCIHRGWPDLSEKGVDRSPAYLPEVEIASLDIIPIQFLRSFCDTIWQAAGMERSLNYDKEGNWHERR